MAEKNLLLAFFVVAKKNYSGLKKCSDFCVDNDIFCTGPTLWLNLFLTESVVGITLELQRSRGSSGLLISVTQKGSINEMMFFIP